MSDPHDTIKAWLPHVVLLIALLLGVWLLAVVFQPVFEPILLAAALALLTTQVLFDPVDTLLERFLPSINPHTRRQISGVVATVLLVAVVVAPVLLLLVATIGSVGGLIDLSWGIATGEAESFTALKQAIANQVDKLHGHFPKLGLAERDIPELVEQAIRDMTNFGTTALSFIFTGTGALMQALLALITLAFLYPQGPRLARGLLAYSPLDDKEISQLQRRHRHVVMRLLTDTVVVAIIKALALGLIIWGVDRTMGKGDLPVVPIAFLAGLLTLLPLVGITMVWLPLAAVVYWEDHRPAAILLGLGSITMQILITWGHHKIGRYFDDRGAWMGFILFLGLIGGLLSFGIKGFIIGPMAVVLVYTLGSFWLPLYGLGDRQALTQMFRREDVEDPTDKPS